MARALHLALAPSIGVGTLPRTVAARFRSLLPLRAHLVAAQESRKEERERERERGGKPRKLTAAACPPACLPDCLMRHGENGKCSFSRSKKKEAVGVSERGRRAGSRQQLLTS